MNKPNDKLNQAIESLRDIPTPKGPSDQLVRQTLNRIQQLQEQLPPATAGERRFSMKNTFKFAAAAAILIGVSLIFLFNSGPNAIALAAVYDKVLQAQAFMYKMSLTMTGMEEMTGMPQMKGPMEMDWAVTVSNEYGTKMENHIKISDPNGQTTDITQLAYILPEEKIMVSIMPQQKMFQRIEMAGDSFEEMKKKNNDPRETIKQMMNCKYVELEQTEINGITVQGFQTTDPSYTKGVAEEVKATLWVDTKTWLPVKNEIWLKMGKMETHGVIDQYQWNVPISAADFEYVIPEDYKEMVSMKMPEMSEEAVVKGFEAYNKFFGRYPEKIDMLSLMTSISKLKDNQETKFAKEFCAKMDAAKAKGDTAVMQEFMQELMMPIQSLAMFHMKLAQDKKDPAYYGKTVTPGDAQAVLLRWKTSDTTYKVIMGDLSVTEMSADQLKQIEPAPEEPQPAQ